MMEHSLLFIKGIEEFNRREFFECHETLEDYWRDYCEVDREFIQGLIQVSVAYHHWLRDNPEGARRLFLRALPRLKPYRPEHMNIHTQPLVQAVEAALARLEAGDNTIGDIPQIKISS